MEYEWLSHMPYASSLLHSKKACVMVGVVRIVTLFNSFFELLISFTVGLYRMLTGICRLVGFLQIFVFGQICIRLNSVNPLVCTEQVTVLQLCVCYSCMLIKSRSVSVSLVIPMSAKARSLILCALKKSAMLHQSLERQRWHLCFSVVLISLLLHVSPQKNKMLVLFVLLSIWVLLGIWAVSDFF